MRKELNNLEWHIYGVSEKDYDYTFRLVKEIINHRQNQINEKIDSIKVCDNKENLLNDSKGITDEVISDLSYYNYVENLFLWHFGLWRLQGIFEGILKNEFFPNKNLQGLKAKLNFVKKLEYVVFEEDFNELIEWGKLRNALSHNPPERYRPSGLREDDVKEYLGLIKRVTKNLKDQKKLKTHHNI